jgi:hypothetical protein
MHLGSNPGRDEYFPLSNKVKSDSDAYPDVYRTRTDALCHALQYRRVAANSDSPTARSFQWKTAYSLWQRNVILTTVHWYIKMQNFVPWLRRVRRRPEDILNFTPVYVNFGWTQRSVDRSGCDQFAVPLSVSFHHCCAHFFILRLLWLQGEAGEGWERRNGDALLDIGAELGRAELPDCCDWLQRVPL